MSKRKWMLSTLSTALTASVALSAFGTPVLASSVSANVPIMQENEESISENEISAPDEEELVSAGNVNMYRMYNPNSGEHFYTAKSNERDSLIKVGWDYEGTGWVAPSKGDPVYRLYNPNAGDHHYTLNENEKNMLINVGWKYEGVGWYSAKTKGAIPVYRQYNPNAKAGAHNFTTSKAENNALVKAGWYAESIAWYASGVGKPAPSKAEIFKQYLPSSITSAQAGTTTYRYNFAQKTLHISRDTVSSLYPLISPDVLGSTQVLATMANSYSGYDQMILFPYLTLVRSREITKLYYGRDKYSFSVNEKGQLTQVVDTYGNKADYSYDAAGRLTLIKYDIPPYPALSFTYDAAGNLTKVFDAFRAFDGVTLQNFRIANNRVTGHEGTGRKDLRAAGQFSYDSHGYLTETLRSYSGPYSESYRYRFAYGTEGMNSITYVKQSSYGANQNETYQIHYQKKN